MRIRPKNITQEGATIGQALVWNGTLWVPGAPHNVGDVGSLYISTPAGTGNTSGTPVKAAGTTTLIKNRNFDSPQNNRLRFTGAVGKTFRATAAISARSTVANVVLKMYFAKGSGAGAAAIIAASLATRKIAAAGDVGAAPLVCVADCIQNDFVEVWLDTDTGNPTITFDQMVLVVEEI